ncbi:MAG: aspartyl protease family protein [Candidatus Omnitrophica bacterium]|nr:aspartyl protease family protein [Candidatus Omnitrophota bacterium]
MEKKRFFVLVLLIFISLPLSAGADSVKLKKGGNLTGIIRQEDDTSITLQIGMGTMKIQKNEIESILKAGEKENDVLESAFRKTAIGRGTFVPPGLEELAKKLNSMPWKNVDAAKDRLDSWVEKLDANSNKIGSLRADFDRKNKEILRINSGIDAQRYNSLIAENNITGAKISELWKDRHKMGPKLSEYQAAYEKTITDYGNEIADFSRYLDKTAEALKKRGMTDDESLYLGTVKKSLADLQKRLREDVATLETARKSFADLQKSLTEDMVVVSKGVHGMTVKAVLNDKVECLLVIDTGATILLITKSIADSLKIDLSDSREGKFSLADGSIIKSRVVKLKSVRVGDSTVYNVAAGITDKPSEPGVDGLLGMSFLKNFKFNLDTENGMLMLEAIK